MRIGYARDVQSTPILQTQIDMLKSVNCKKIFVSRRTLEKADIMQTTNYFIREGEDTIIVCKLLCLDKSLKLSNLIWRVTYTVTLIPIVFVCYIIYNMYIIKVKRHYAYI